MSLPVSTLTGYSKTFSHIISSPFSPPSHRSFASIPSVFFVPFFFYFNNYKTQNSSSISLQNHTKNFESSLTTCVELCPEVMTSSCLPSSSSASNLPLVTPVSQRLLSGARIGVVIGGDTAQGKSFIEHLLSSAGGDWLLKVTPPLVSSSSSSSVLSLLPFPELSVELWGKDDRKWREEEENIVSAMRGAFGVYVAMFPIVKRPKDSHPPSKLEVEQDPEMEIRVAQRLGRCAQQSGVHHFVFSGRDIRSEACIMTLHPGIQSVLFLRVDTFLEDLVSIVQDHNGKGNSNINEDEVVALISTKDLGILAAASFLDPQKFKLPGKVNIDPVSSEIVSKRKLLEKLWTQSLEDKEAVVDMIPSVGAAGRKMRTGMATTLQLLPSADNLSSWVETGKR